MRVMASFHSRSVFKIAICVLHCLNVSKRLSQLLDGFEGPHPQQVLVERSDEPFGVTVAFGGARTKAGEHRHIAQWSLPFDLLRGAGRRSEGM